MRKKAKPVNVEVKPRKNESPERMIKRFIKKSKKARIVKENMMLNIKTRRK